MNEKPTIFIHTNRKQMIGALVSKYSMRRYSDSPDSFDVRILVAEDYEFLMKRHGHRYLRDGVSRVWDVEDLQSFTPLRFMPPSALGYRGRALVVDPDVFAMGDVWELLSCDMRDKAILCRRRGRSENRAIRYASSVMLLDCARLEHWDVEQDFGQLFTMNRDYADWISLLLEPEETIGQLSESWNDFDRVTSQTRLLHNTRRETQPWKTGLPVDFSVSRPRLQLLRPRSWRRWLSDRVHGKSSSLTHYARHPDVEQERFFFRLLGECVAAGIVSRDMLHKEMQQNHVRHDAMEMLDRVYQEEG